MGAIHSKDLYMEVFLEGGHYAMRQKNLKRLEVALI